ncbi:MAG: tetratricopeptide repeat protein [Bacteroides sp.]|jgi:tetratricopeptide (TPR) repeat protein|nr:tetratricopeptide repeat protein [Bacteroides sp.]
MKSFRFRNIILFVIVGVIGFSACKTAKAPVESSGAYLERQMITETDKLESSAILIEATRQKILGNWPQAIVLFLDAIEKDPGNDAAYFELAKAHAMQGEFEDALKFAKQAAEIDPDNPYYLTVLADIYTLSNQVEESLAIYQKLTDKYPERVDYLMSLANTYLYAERHDDAIAVYNRIEEITGYTEEVSLQKQKLLMDLGRMEEAVTEGERLVELFPDEPMFAEMLSDLYMQTGRLEEARGMFEEIVASDPENPMGHLMMADYFQEKGEPENAFESLKKAFRSPRLDTENKGRIMYTFYNLSGENPDYLDQALELCEILIELHPEETEPYLIYGDFLAREERLEEARDKFLEGALRDPSNLNVWQQIMVLDNQMGDYEALLEHSNQTLEYFFEQPLPFLFNGLANLQLKNYKDAASSLEYGAGIVQNDEELSIQFYSMLGDTYYYLGDFERSDRSYEKALELEPNNATVLNNYAYHLSLRKARLTDAEAMASEANRLQPGTSSYQDTLGWVLYQLGRYQEAAEWIGMAVQDAEETSGTVLEHYGDVLFRLGQTEQALEYWQKALDAGDTSELLPEKIKDLKLHE